MVKVFEFTILETEAVSNAITSADLCGAKEIILFRGNSSAGNSYPYVQVTPDDPATEPSPQWFTLRGTSYAAGATVLPGTAFRGLRLAVSGGVFVTETYRVAVKYA